MDPVEIEMEMEAEAQAQLQPQVGSDLGAPSTGANPSVVEVSSDEEIPADKMKEFVAKAQEAQKKYGVQNINLKYGEDPESVAQAHADSGFRNFSNAIINSATFGAADRINLHQYYKPETIQAYADQNGISLEEAEKVFRDKVQDYYTASARLSPTGNIAGYFAQPTPIKGGAVTGGLKGLLTKAGLMGAAKSGLSTALQTTLNGEGQDKDGLVENPSLENLQERGEDAAIGFAGGLGGNVVGRGASSVGSLLARLQGNAAQRVMSKATAESATLNQRENQRLSVPAAEMRKWIRDMMEENSSDYAKVLDDAKNRLDPSSYFEFLKVFADERNRMMQEAAEGVAGYVKPTRNPQPTPQEIFEREMNPGNIFKRQLKDVGTATVKELKKVPGGEALMKVSGKLFKMSDPSKYHMYGTLRKVIDNPAAYGEAGEAIAKAYADGGLEGAIRERYVQLQTDPDFRAKQRESDGTESP